MKPIVAIIFLACVAFLIWWFENSDEVNSYNETAINRVRETMRDPDAKIENVVFHPVPGPGPGGHSYACGSATSSTAISALSRRFIYYIGANTVSFMEEIRNPDQLANTNALCNSAPTPIDQFDTSNGKMRLKTSR
jgi:hypothetical protein